MGKYGTNLEGFGGFEGGVNADKGAPLVSTSSDGETALLFGPAALREIQSNVANGDFAIPPDEADQTITTENPLPYWTGSATGSAPTVSAAITSSAVTASGSALTFTVAASAATNSAYTITRYVPIAGNLNRSSAYHPEVYVAAVTGGLTDKGRVRLTLTATAVDSNYSALTVTATANATASALPSGSLFTDWIVPDGKAAYILVSVKVDVPATAPAAAVTFVISEVRVARSESAIAFPSVVGASSQPWLMLNDNGNLEIYRQASGADPKIQMISNASSGVYDINLEAADVNGVVSLSGNGSVEIEGGIVNVTAYGGNLNLQPGGNGTVMGGDTYTAGGATIVGAVGMNSTLSVDSTIQGGGVIRSVQASATSNAFTARTTADSNPRYAVDCSGLTEWGTGGARDVNLYRGASNILQTDDDFRPSGIRVVSPDTTTQTSSAAIWVVISGTEYRLRRNSSSARYKTNIVDADEVVLEAARKVKPRHYESTIEDENGATRLGFIAEEIHESGLTHAVGYDAEGKPETIDPVALIAALWHRVSDLEDRLKALEQA